MALVYQVGNQAGPARAAAAGKTRIQLDTLRDGADMRPIRGRRKLGGVSHPAARPMTVLLTSRLRLVPLADQHLAGLDSINGDPAVMAHIGDGAPLTLPQSQLMIATVGRHWAEHGMSWWALLRRDDGFMVGAAALQPLEARAGAVAEIGWRLRRSCWGLGYATEAAQAAIGHARAAGEARVVAVAYPRNLASIAVMQRLGMRYRGLELHYDTPCVTFELALRK